MNMGIVLIKAIFQISILFNLPILLNQYQLNFTSYSP